MYEYLIGCLILGAVWLPLFDFRRDLRRPMLWSGTAYLAVITLLTIAFQLYFTLVPLESWRTITPGYWEPKTIFGIELIAGRYAMEDALFMFLTGGIAAAIYEYLFRAKIKFLKTRRHHVRAPLIGASAALIFAALVRTNLIYPLIVFGFAGAATIWLERRNLVWHSLWGGVSFAGIYLLSFGVFNAVFPNFISDAYHLENVSGILFLGIPLEEFLYAMSFGVLWASLYEYEHGVKTKSI